ncbi:reverse transcriptase domain-containing protein [Tanacetum coccineum]|uniref:Reverse transcriptase domain-containing protein n=1 Tax=Tanacetum coccineum TaxID=301880 RepID=A0ABQ4YZI8_9ASTR
MRTRSQSREQRPPPPEGPPVVIEPLRIEYPFQEDPTVEPMADTRTMASIAPSTHRGDEDATLILKFVQTIRAEAWVNQSVQNKQLPFRRVGQVEIFLDKMPRECFKNHREQSKVRQHELRQLLSKLPAPAPVKAVELSCVTCGGAHSHQNCPATHGNDYRDNISEYVSQAAAANYNQVSSLSDLKWLPNHIRLQTHGVSKTDFERYVTANDAVLRNMQNQGQNLQSQMANLTDMLSKFVTAKHLLLPVLRALPVNPVTTQGRFKSRALIDVHKGELTLRIGSEAITYNLDQTSRYSANYTHMTANKIDVIDMACEEYSQEVLGFTDVIASGNSTPYYDPIVATSSPTLTPFGDSDFLLLEEADSFLGLADDPDCPAYNPFYYDPEGDILILEAILNSEPPLPPPSQGTNPTYLPEVRTELKVCETNTANSSVDEPTEVELKELPPHLEYAFLEGDNKLPVIIAKELDVEEKSALVKVLKSHKRALAWKLSDIQGINPEFCTHKILMEEDYAPAVQHQRRVNPKIHDVIKKEVEKLLEAGLIYPISDSPWCEDTNLSLNWEKSHFMVKEGIVLGHKISKKGIEVDKAKIDVIAKLPHPTTVKGIGVFSSCRFLPAVSYRLQAPILIAPNWDLPFELMCDASDFAIGAVLGQRHEKHFRPIHYASKTLIEAQTNYTTTEKELLAIVYAFEKFRMPGESAPMDDTLYVVAVESSPVHSKTSISSAVYSTAMRGSQSFLSRHHRVLSHISLYTTRANGQRAAKSSQTCTPATDNPQNHPLIQEFSRELAFALIWCSTLDMIGPGPIYLISDLLEIHQYLYIVQSKELLSIRLTVKQHWRGSE